VDIEDYCYRHAETNLRHQPCSECTDPRLARSITRLNDATSAS